MITARVAFSWGERGAWVESRTHSEAWVSLNSAAPF